MWFKKPFLLRKYPYLLTLLILCSVIMLIFYEKKFTEEEIIFEDIVPRNISKFIVNTPGCQIPDWDPWDPSIKQLYEPVVGPYKCEGRISILQVLPRGIVSLDNTIVELYYEVKPENVSCYYRSIFRDGKIDNFTIDSTYKLGPLKKLTFDVPLNDDFIKTTCQLLGSDHPEFIEYLTLTPLKPQVELKKSVHRQNLNKMFNIMFIGIDSISSLQFQRHFPKCFNYLKGRPSTYTMKGYTKVGDNTFPNLMPMLTGHFYYYYWTGSKNRTMYFDDVDFIWKEFDRKGYRTFFAEDAPEIATFNYLRSGFKKPPTDYYYRPFALSVENSDDVKLNNQYQCIGNKMEIQVIYDYLKNFLSTMEKSRPFFTFTFLARLTHDYFNQAGYADEPTYQLLKFLEESQITSNTVIVFFSDHGIRFGPIRRTYVGQFEARMPFMYLIFPKWFSRKYPKISLNLKQNQERLTTPFDIYETILQFVNFTGDNFDTSNTLKSLNMRYNEADLSQSFGLNLFHEVPNYRTCQTAGISPHWCTCQSMKLIDIANEIVIKGAICIVDTINQWVETFKPKCSVLKLGKIHNARILKSQNATSNNNNNNILNQNISVQVKFMDYLIVVSTNPGLGIFEGTVRCNPETEICNVVGDMSRINRYGNQSACITDVRIKKYCFCI